MEGVDGPSEPAAQAAGAAAAGALQLQPGGREAVGHGRSASLSPAGSRERSMQHQESAVHGEGAQAAAVTRQVLRAVEPGNVHDLPAGVLWRPVLGIFLCGLF